MDQLAQSLINHVGLVLDASGSMSRLQNEVVKVADSQVQELATVSTKMDQETRGTVYTFSDPNDIRCHFYDKDVLRLPSLKGEYRIRGNTALIDASMKAIEDLEQSATLYGDHAFLVYVLTDGQENSSRKYGGTDLQKKLKALPDNWTVAALVPDERGVYAATKFGFYPGNVAIWSATAEGMIQVGQKIQQATTMFMEQRALGVRGTRRIFQASTKQVDFSSLPSLVPVTNYELLRVGPNETRQIRDFVEQEASKIQQYKLGCAYYQLTKPEDVQASKKVAVLDKATSQIYTGDQARQAVGLPLRQTVRAMPEKHGDKLIFIQSTSVNRKLVPNTTLLLIP